MMQKKKDNQTVFIKWKNSSILERPEVRINLLKAGFTGPAIEKLYVELKNFKISY